MKSDLTAWLRSPRVLLAVVLLAVLAWGGLRPYYARFLVVDRAPWAKLLSEFPDRKSPGYADLLTRAAPVVPDEAPVAVLYPTLEWHGGYSYAYFRAQYLLPGRTIIPLGWPSGARLDRLSEAEWLLAFQTSPPRQADWVVVEQTSDWKLMRRSK